MEIKKIDLRGELCPRPLMITRDTYQKMLVNEEVVLLIDNETAKENVERYLRDNNIQVKISQESGVYFFHLKKGTDNLVADPNAYCIPAITKGTGNVVVISSKCMGHGPEDLGLLLMQAFLNTLKDLADPPSKILFYNSGIHLALNDSPVLNSLKVLQERGVKILVCGSCLNYFVAKERLGVGVVSNMFEIIEAQIAASRVVRP